MALGICTICSANRAKYKCPKCAVEYCSLACFKSEKHSHGSGEHVTESANCSTSSAAADSAESAGPVERSDDPQLLFQTIASDPVVRSLLRYKSLQVHLAVLLKLLSDSSLTREPIYENRKEIVNMRLCELRIGGSEENELVEEFVQRVLYLHEKGTSEMKR